MAVKNNGHMSNRERSNASEYNKLVWCDHCSFQVRQGGHEKRCRLNGPNRKERRAMASSHKDEPVASVANSSMPSPVEGSTSGGQCTDHVACMAEGLANLVRSPKWLSCDECTDDVIKFDRDRRVYINEHMMHRVLMLRQLLRDVLDTEECDTCSLTTKWMGTLMKLKPTGWKYVFDNDYDGATQYEMAKMMRIKVNQKRHRFRRVRDKTFPARGIDTRGELVDALANYAYGSWCKEACELADKFETDTVSDNSWARGLAYTLAEEAKKTARQAGEAVIAM
jgi:hypothetical protein